MDIEQAASLPLKLTKVFPQVRYGLTVEKALGKTGDKLAYELHQRMLREKVLFRLSRLTMLWPDQESLFDAFRLAASLGDLRTNYTEFYQGDDNVRYKLTIIYGPNAARPSIHIDVPEETE